MYFMTARVLTFSVVHGTRITFSRLVSAPNRDLRRYFHPKVFETGPMTATKLDIPCIWGGTLAGTLLKKTVTDSSASPQATTTKIVGIHGWLDNLSSLLPLAEKLIDRHPNYEIFLYDRAGHGFSSHLPRGFDYSHAHNLQDLRGVIQTLGWDKEKIGIIGHSYGAMLGMTYAACYPHDLLCVVAIDALLRVHVTLDSFWNTVKSRLETNAKVINAPSRAHKIELTLEIATELTKASRPGLTDQAAVLLTERSIRRNADGKLQFTRDEALKILSLFPFTSDMVRSGIEAIKAPLLFIGALKPQWPSPQESIDLLQQCNPQFEMTLIDGPHHLHITHLDQVLERADTFLSKYLPSTGSKSLSDSKL